AGLVGGAVDFKTDAVPADITKFGVGMLVAISGYGDLAIQIGLTVDVELFFQFDDRFTGLPIVGRQIELDQIHTAPLLGTVEAVFNLITEAMKVIVGIGLIAMLPDRTNGIIGR